MKRAQNSQRDTSNTKRVQKRCSTRRRRQRERRDPENAPVRDDFHEYTK